MRKPLRLYRVTAVAESLGMNIRTLDRRMEEMGIVPSKIGRFSVRFINDIELDALKAQVGIRKKRVRTCK